MCGITAFIAFDNNSLKLSDIYNMNNQIKHRGPDDEGYLVIDQSNQAIQFYGNDTPLNSIIRTNAIAHDINSCKNLQVKFAIGHRRLAIVDLSEGGHQPLSINNGNYWICYNGEVYNYIEIREELEILKLYLQLIKNGVILV
jgi:asparagine synthase (glutamine-hydrolysing)